MFRDEILGHVQQPAVAASKRALRLFNDLHEDSTA